MKKLCIGIVILILIAAGAFLFFSNSNTLGSMKDTITEASSSRSEITFELQKDGLIKFEYSSNVESGLLSFVLIDNEGSVIDTFNSNGSSSKELKLKKNITYILSVSYDEFIGNYQIKVIK